MSFSFKTLIVIVCLSITQFSSIAQTADNAQTKEIVFNKARVYIKGKQLDVELADTWDLRAQGLMWRKELCTDCGMLFEFDRTRMISMWMKNTLIPLDVAFFEAGGKIIDIKQMQPLDLTSVPSSAPVYYALEMNQGWFAKNGIKEGDKIKVLKARKSE